MKKLEIFHDTLSNVALTIDLTIFETGLTITLNATSITAIEDLDKIGGSNRTKVYFGNNSIIVKEQRTHVLDLINSL